jgi:hypothetical protein
MWAVKFQIKFPTDVGMVSAHSNIGEQKKAGEIMNFHIAVERKIINLCAVKKSL